MRHPHPGFPTLARLDDVCGSCYVDDATEKFHESLHAQAAEKERESERLQGASGWRRLAAVTAVALIATAAAAAFRRR